MRYALTVFMLLSWLAPSPAEVDRLGDFEWAAELTAEERAKQHIDDQEAHSGKYSLCYQSAAGGEYPFLESILVADTFETAEFEVEGWIKLEGEGTLCLVYPGDGRTGFEVIESPTDGWQPIKLHLRANPDRDAGESYRLEVNVTLRSASGKLTWRLDDVFAKPLYQHRIPRTDTPPVIDGDLSDACWSERAYAGDPYWRMYNKPRDAREPTHVWCCYDDEHLYAAFRCVTRAPGRLVTNISKHDGRAWIDDSAEIFFNPSHDHARYYEYIVTPRDVVFDSKWWREGGAWQVDWHYFGQWKAAVEKDAWVVEIALDLRSYEQRDLQGNPTGYMELPTGDVAGILFSRNDRVLGEGMSWADCIGSFHEVYQYGHLVGFRPVRTEPYRKYALREIERLEARWQRMHRDAGYPPPIPAKWRGLQDGTEGLPEAIAALKERAQAERPGFDEWVEIGREIERLDTWLNRARTALVPMMLQTRAGGEAEALRPQRGLKVASLDADLAQFLPVEASRPQWGLAVASPMELWLLRQCQETLRAEEVVRISAARGESEPVHLLLIPWCEQPEQVSVQCRALVGPGGGIGPPNCRVYELRELSLRPCAVVPLDPKQWTELWCVIEVPRDAEAGVYRGEISAGTERCRARLPLELTVHDFALPRQPSLAVSVGFDPWWVAYRWYGKAGALSAREYWPLAEELLRHRVTPREMLADFTRWDQGGLDFSEAEELLTRAELEGVRPDALIAARPRHLEGLPQAGAKLAQAVRHWRVRTGVEVIPTYVPVHRDLLTGVLPKERRASIAALGDFPNDHSLPAAAQMLGIWGLHPSAAVGLAWPYLWHFDRAAFADWAAERGKDTVWHLPPYGEDQTFDWGGLHMDVETRMLGWVAFDYRLDRILLDEDRDEWHEEQSSDFGYHLLGGRGSEEAASCLLYVYDVNLPHDAGRLDRPQPSVRLELLREGLEDYEYLYMLNQLNRRLSRIGGAQKYTRLSRENSWLLKLDDRIIKNVRSYTHDPEVVMQWREALARQIERTRAVLRRHGEEGLPGDQVE